MKIRDFEIDLEHPPFVVAEMSGNHNRSLERALETVDVAARAGVHALKLQTYTADTLTLNLQDGEFVIRDKRSLWNGRSLYDLYSEAYTPWEWHEPLLRRARERGILCFSAPFDESAVDFLETLDVPLYKIASPEIVHLPLIRKAAGTGKPLVVSTGMAALSEIDEAVRTARRAGCREVILLKCTTAYPALPEDSNILTIPHMRKMFGCEVGLSDHTLGIGVAIAAVAHGASVVEKHFTVSRAEGGVDSAFSLEPDEMEALVIESERAWRACGTVKYGPTEDEESSLGFRRSLYVCEDMEAGDLLTRSNLRCIRPGHGLAPRYYETVLGREIKHSVKKGTPLSWDLI